MSDADNRDDAPAFTDSGPWTDDRATLGDRIAAAREALRFSPERLAWRLGVPRATILGWEDDRAGPRSNRMQMLAGVLNAPLVRPMTGVGDGPARPPEAGALIAGLAA